MNEHTHIDYIITHGRETYIATIDICARECVLRHDIPGGAGEPVYPGATMRHAIYTSFMAAHNAIGEMLPGAKISRV